MIESTSLFRDMGLKSIPTLAFIATFYWFNTQMQASVSLLSEKIESTNLRIDVIDRRIDDSRVLSKAQFELLNNKITMYQENTNRQLNDMQGRITRIEDKLTQVIEYGKRQVEFKKRDGNLLLAEKD